MISYAIMWRIIAFILLILIVGGCILFMTSETSPFHNVEGVPPSINKYFFLLLLSNVITIIVLFFRIWIDLVNTET